jgi:tetratricopeptide (TPR) repeat protein
VDARELEGRAEQYTKVVEMNPQGKYVKEAAYAAVLAWKKRAQRRRPRAERSSVENDREKMKAQGRASSQPLNIPEYQQKMIGAFDTYLKYVPDAPESVTIKYRKARIYYEYNHFDEAGKLFEDIVNKHSEARAGRSTRRTCCSTRSTRRGRPRRSCPTSTSSSRCPSS